MLNVRIRNFLGVRAADFPLAAGITLIAGDNAAGKSSLLEAVRATALGLIDLRGTRRKSDAAALLHQGEEAGSCTLDWGAGTQRLLLPDAAVESTGAPKTMGTALGLGAVRFSDLDAKQRGAEFAARFGQGVTVADIAAWLEENGGKAADAEGLYARVDTSGWDAVHKTAREAATKLKGQWEGVTRVNWGDARAGTWRPAILLPDEVYDPQEIAAAIETAQAELAALEEQGYVDRAEVDRLTPIADEVDALDAEVKRRQAEVRALQATVERLVGDRAKLPPPTEHGGRLLPCPHCDGNIQVSRTANGDTVLMAPTALALAESPEQMKERALAMQRATDAIRAGRKRTDEATEELGEARQRLKAAKDAAARLAELADAKEQGAAPADRVADARLAVEGLQIRLTAVNDMIRARGIFNDWKDCQPLIACLAPEGVRAAVARRALDAANADLAAIATAGGWGEVALTDDLDLTLAGRPYRLLSESERWRVDAAMTLVLAKREGAAFTTLDRLDVLNAPHRGGAFKAVLAAGLPVLVAATAKDKLPGTLPKLKAANAGTVYWLEKGVAEEQAL